MTFQYINSTAPVPSNPTSNFTITAPPSTDIWRKPPTHNAFTAPILYRILPLSQFHRIRVEISAPWKTLYDQGGLLFARPHANGGMKWVKAGIEFFNGQPCASVVAKDNWADWSLVEIESDTVTLEFARESIPETDEPSLWVYFVEDWGGRRPIREVTWAFEGGVSGEKGKEEECWVGVYAAKPTPTAADPSEELEVQFSGLIIE